MYYIHTHIYILKQHQKGNRTSTVCLLQCSQLHIKGKIIYTYICMYIHTYNTIYTFLLRITSFHFKFSHKFCISDWIATWRIGAYSIIYEYA